VIIGKAGGLVKLMYRNGILTAARNKPETSRLLRDDTAIKAIWRQMASNGVNCCKILKYSLDILFLQVHFSATSVFSFPSDGLIASGWKRRKKRNGMTTRNQLLTQTKGDGR
jgi:hypothetical protein